MSDADRLPSPHVPPSPSDETIDKLIADFEAAAQVDDDGNEYWFARDVERLLGYSKWDSFLAVIAKAKEACTQAGRGCDDHFAGVGKWFPLGAGRPARSTISC